MDAYRSVLEKIARRDLLLTIFATVVLLLIVGTVWVIEGRYFQRMKKNQPRKYNSEKQVKLRRQSLFATIALTIICAAMIVFFVVDTANQNEKINKDIEECSYATYNGGYYISPTVSGRKSFYPWRTVIFDDAGYARLYVDGWEGLLPDVGDFEGTVVYGKHSLIVVYIDGDEN